MTANVSYLHVEGLKKSYRSRVVVNDVSLSLQQGEVVGLLGPNGAGKTTTFQMIVGLIRAERGTIKLDEVSIAHKPMFKRARLGLGYLPQEPSVFRDLTVRENLLVVMQFQGVPKQERDTKADALIQEFGLEHVSNNKGSECSGGERRRTEIARALATDPKFLLLDEPFAGIDPIAVEEIQHIIADLKKRNLGVLITDHNVHETLAITDRTYLMYSGKVFKEGTPEELAEDEEARNLYLGKQFHLERYQQKEASHERDQR
ncbi:MAG TPA: LPS export ABC transporter ATP-binding protein [Bacteroidetes bacterium]|nr:MAG: LPS export ABC transporter ATP-binding protein [Rhodothermaeota bacterium MED-G64]RPF80314.1 MAG: LPS export ABC transporter ATP-binding protein [Rhodothermaceae bacterium TMED105]HBD42110.1 LPS export ABC transporter ATP-binding protein [Bacteroidota bacterium]HBW00203.1 LPS export ABC transporter ATP-binding protein [Bacteroidota bacterium]|tara:strand:+ start:17254 stop:18033 length:780 start_codon:yes stop_codon:yes gene_type:complete